MPRLLVTGCNGFIGKHLASAAIKSGHSVHGVDIRQLQEDAPVHPSFHFSAIDLTNHASTHGICRNIDTVIHLAAIPREDLSKTWNDYVSVNIDASVNLLNEAARAGVKRFIFISTVEAAGFGNGTRPRIESDTPAPVNFYGKSKLAAEEQLKANATNVELVILRLPMIYGPGTDLIDAKLFGMVKRRIYPLIGNGNTLMEFCFVKNAVDAILLSSEHPAAANELFYVSDIRSYSIREVITAVAKGVGVSIHFICIPPALAYGIAYLWELFAKIFPVPPFIMPASKKPFFSRQTVWWTTRNVNIVSIDKIVRTLGFSPAISIDQGCRETAAWFATRNRSGK